MDEVIRLFNKNRIRYLVFGGQAVRLQGMPRFSMDWDFFIPGNDPDNMQRINALLEDELALPLVPIGPKGENLIQTYQTRWGILQFHLSVAGIRSFDEAEAHAMERVNENGTTVRLFSLDDLIRSKEAVGRPRDLEDLEFLKLMRSRGPMVDPHDERKRER
jgi:hypothetical protein